MAHSYEITMLTLTDGKKRKKTLKLKEVRGFLTRRGDCNGILDYQDANGQPRGLGFTITEVEGQVFLQGLRPGDGLYKLEKRERKLYMTEQMKR